MDLSFLRPGCSEYVFVTALRGPDNPDLEPLKALVTTRMRSLCFTDEECLGNYCIEPVRAYEVEQVAEFLYLHENLDKLDVRHFLYHLASGLNSCNDAKIWNGFAPDIEVILHAATAGTQYYRTYYKNVLERHPVIKYRKLSGDK